MDWKKNFKQQVPKDIRNDEEAVFGEEPILGVKIKINIPIEMLRCVKNTHMHAVFCIKMCLSSS